jgi:hypothetical protein
MAGLGGGLYGNGAEFPFFKLAPVLLYIANDVFWVICQFDKPNGSASSLGLSSIPSLSDGVMLGTAWIDRPVETQGCAPASTSSSAQHGSAPMLTPMIDNPLAFLRCRPEALPRRPETADTVAAA